MCTNYSPVCILLCTCTCQGEGRDQGLVYCRTQVPRYPVTTEINNSRTETRSTPNLHTVVGVHINTTTTTFLHINIYPSFPFNHFNIFYVVYCKEYTYYIIIFPNVVVYCIDIVMPMTVGEILGSRKCICTSFYALFKKTIM